MEQEQEIKIRYYPPRKFDIAPYGSVVQVLNENGNCTFYVQASKEKGSNWIKMGDLLENLFSNKFKDPEFIITCLEKKLHIEVSHTEINVAGE